jgi:hypothetical protein
MALRLGPEQGNLELLPLWDREFREDGVGDGAEEVPQADEGEKLRLRRCRSAREYRVSPSARASGDLVPQHRLADASLAADGEGGRAVDERVEEALALGELGVSADHALPHSHPLLSP